MLRCAVCGGPVKHEDGSCCGWCGAALENCEDPYVGKERGEMDPYHDVFDDSELAEMAAHNRRVAMDKERDMEKRVWVEVGGGEDFLVDVLVEDVAEGEKVYTEVGGEDMDEDRMDAVLMAENDVIDLEVMEGPGLDNRVYPIDNGCEDMVEDKAVYRGDTHKEMLWMSGEMTIEEEREWVHDAYYDSGASMERDPGPVKRCPRGIVPRCWGGCPVFRTCSRREELEMSEHTCSVCGKTFQGEDWRDAWKEPVCDECWIRDDFEAEEFNSMQDDLIASLNIPGHPYTL